MASLNKVFLIGNLTRNPELRYTPGGSAVCDMTVAINRSFTLNDGTQKRETTFVDVNAWGHQAETANRYLQKGSSVFVEGRISIETWEDKDKNRRTKFRVVAERIQFLTPKGAGGAPQGGSPADEIPEDEGQYGNERPGGGQRGSYRSGQGAQQSYQSYGQGGGTQYQQGAGQGRSSQGSGYHGYHQQAPPPPSFNEQREVRPIQSGGAPQQNFAPASPQPMPEPMPMPPPMDESADDAFQVEDSPERDIPF